MNQSGYYRFPTISGTKVIFVCEDDLWSVSSSGGDAIRLTSNLAEVSHPYLSPDGGTVAFKGKEEGNTEVYCMDAEGGHQKRLTFFGSMSYPVGWSADGKEIVVASNAAQPFERIFNLYTISPEGGMPERLPVGYAHTVSFGPGGASVIGRNTADPARWKRYRGGRAGVLWIDRSGAGEFEKFLDLKGNLASPLWLDERIYFLSDHEGIGRLYSCLADGSDLQRHTHNTEYYARNASSDGKRIVYHAGAELYLFDPANDSSAPIEVKLHSPQVQRNRKFVSAEQFLEDYHIHPDGHSVMVTSRGKSFYFGAWENAVVQVGAAKPGRNRLTRWLGDSRRFVTLSDSTGEEIIEIHEEGNETPSLLEGLDIGRPLHMEVSPDASAIALSNHRYELIVVNLEAQSCRVLDKSAYGRIAGISWSPDGKWIAYGCSETQQTCSIKLVDVDSGNCHIITPPRFRDINPSFDPLGQYLYFLSYREFNPVYDSMHFDLNFPRGARPYLITLQKEIESPFVQKPRTPEAEEMGGIRVTPQQAASEKNGKPDSSTVAIDFEGIQHRIKAFPVPEARYDQIKGLKGRVLFSSLPIIGSLNNNISPKAPDKATLELFDLGTGKTDKIAVEVDNFIVSAKTETLMYRSGKRLRVQAISPMINGQHSDNTPSRKTGWIDLNRIKLSVNPTEEWRQMFREIWRLQREHFWTDNMSGIDWEQMYLRYAPILEKVSTRSEFSDIVWELQGELGTSHAYEYGGDYRKEPDYKQGFLGADFIYDPARDAYKVQHIVRGDSWYKDADSPFNSLGANIQPGDILTKVSHTRVNKTCSPQELLVNQAGATVPFTFVAENGTERVINLEVMSGESKVRYREWVESNRAQTHSLSEGRIGYVHIPNMGPLGYAEFHRYYLAEIDRDALLVDVRYNGGGHVSQLILEKLARKRIGYNVNRWGKPFPYPSDSVHGPIIELTNECAGSDGDIFSHCFKLMNIGTLIGTRTWGGVIGIWPRHALVDGSVTTQPEFSFWFRDVAWKVENYGTDPDIEVEITPQDWARGHDSQLHRGIELLMRQLEQDNPRLPDFGSKPNLAAPL